MKVTPRAACRLVFVGAAGYLGVFGDFGTPGVSVGSVVAVTIAALCFFLLLVDFFFGVLGR